MSNKTRDSRDIGPEHRVEAKYIKHFNDTGVCVGADGYNANMRRNAVHKDIGRRNMKKDSKNPKNLNNKYDGNEDKIENNDDIKNERLQIFEWLYSSIKKPADPKPKLPEPPDQSLFRPKSDIDNSNDSKDLHTSDANKKICNVKKQDDELQKVKTNANYRVVKINDPNDNAAQAREFVAESRSNKGIKHTNVASQNMVADKYAPPQVLTQEIKKPSQKFLHTRKDSINKVMNKKSQSKDLMDLNIKKYKYADKNIFNEQALHNELQSDNNPVINHELQPVNHDLKIYEDMCINVGFPHIFSKRKNKLLRNIRVDVMYARINGAVVTDIKPHAMDSIGIDSYLMHSSGIINGMKVYVLNTRNGESFTTYAMEEGSNNGVVSVNGSMAYSLQKGDSIVILAFANVKLKYAQRLCPKIITLDINNNIINDV